MTTPYEDALILQGWIRGKTKTPYLWFSINTQQDGPNEGEPIIEPDYEAISEHIHTETFSVRLPNGKLLTIDRDGDVQVYNSSNTKAESGYVYTSEREE